MSGTIFGVPLSQQLDVNGVPLSGCLLYLYLASTSTPATAYQNFGLTPGLEMPFPIQADAAGRIPIFWLADGVYRARLTSSAGVLIYDLDGIQALGPSVGTSGGGGGVSTASTFSVGDPIWRPIDSTVDGWLRCNGRTFGSASSGAVERANADTQALYEYCWANFPDSICPVSGGRGSSAINDFNANKAMTSLDMRGATAAGMDTMGNTAAGIIAAATSAAVFLGASTSSALLAHTHDATGLSAASHNHSYSGTTSTESATHTHAYTSPNNDHVTSITGGQATSGPGVAANTGGQSANHTHSYSGTTSFSGGLSISGTLGTAGSGSSFSILSPLRAGTWYLKL